MNNLTSWLWEVMTFMPLLYNGIARKMIIKSVQALCQRLLAMKNTERNGCKFLTL